MLVLFVSVGGISLSLSLAAVILLIWRGATKNIRILCLALLLALGLMWVVYSALAGINGNGFDESVVYHLGTGLDGAGVAGYERYVAKWSMVAVSGLLLLGILFRYGIGEPRQRCRQHWAAGILIVALGFNPIIPQIVAQMPLIKALMYQPSLEDSEPSLGELARYYREPPARGLDGLHKNIVLLYLESLESTYFDTSRFGELLPKLTALADEAVQFSGVEMGHYTWWTMGGIVGSQCGVPLVPFGAVGGNDHVGFVNFMAGVTCIGDILRAEGYRTEFVGGASSRFAGKADYLRSHGYQTAWGRDELKRIFPPTVPLNAWGFYDDQTLAFAQERFDALYASGRPFMLTALTLDTHPPHGFPSPRCLKEGVVEGDNQILDAVRCTDHLAAEFIRSIRARDHRGDTLVVVLTDHLSHKNSVYETLLSAQNRHLLFWVFDPEKKGVVIRTKGATTFDVAATTLALAGGQLDGLGFGRNLLADKIPPAPQEGLFHRHTADLMSKLWRPPTLGGELIVMPEQQVLIVGGQRLRVPVMIRFDEHYRIDDVAWPSADTPLITRLDTPLSIMINDCAWFDDQKAGRLCLYYRTRSGVLSAYPLERGAVLERETLVGLLEDRKKSVPLRLEERRYLVSSGGSTKFSGALWQGEIKRLTRGVNLMRVDGGVEILASVDTCAANVDKTAVEKFDKRFHDTAGKLYLVVQDSAVCGNNHLAELLNITNAKGLAQLGFREPYIAVIDEHKKVQHELKLGAEERIYYPIATGQSSMQPKL